MVGGAVAGTLGVLAGLVVAGGGQRAFCIRQLASPRLEVLGGRVELRLCPRLPLREVAERRLDRLGARPDRADLIIESPRLERALGELRVLVGQPAQLAKCASVHGRIVSRRATLVNLIQTPDCECGT